MQMPEWLALEKGLIWPRFPFTAFWDSICKAALGRGIFLPTRTARLTEMNDALILIHHTRNSPTITFFRSF